MQIQEFFPIDDRIMAAAEAAEKRCREDFAKIEDNAAYNGAKVLAAFQKSRVSEPCFYGTTGYGYGDQGREVLDKVVAAAFHTEDALVRHNFVSGTHALSVALFGILRTGDTMVSLTDRPYDTLEGVIGLNDDDKSGSLKNFGVTYKEVPLTADDTPDYDAIPDAVRGAKVAYIQRSRGYSLRPALTVAQIQRMAELVRSTNPDAVIMVDNCYGEFVEANEPSDFGADMIVGSLIKNPGGGLAPIGGYICGTQKCVDRCAYRLSAPGLGQEVGANLGLMPALYQGFFLAPSVVSGAVKGAVFVAACYEKLGFTVVPSSKEARHDIIQCVELGSPEGMVAFCKGIQSAAAVDSYVDPVPAPMPGYDSDVIMAAGAFVQGSSIELSADGPVREPYAVYYQGGLTWYHAKLGVLLSLQKMLDAGLITLP